MPTPALLRKPIKQVTDLTEEPRMNVPKMRKMTGELQLQRIAEPSTPPRSRVLKESAYSVLFFLGLVGKHEKGITIGNRFAVFVIVLSFTIISLCSSHVGDGSRADLNVATTASLQGAKEKTFVSPEEIAPTPVAEKTSTPIVENDLSGAEPNSAESAAQNCPNLPEADSTTGDADFFTVDSSRTLSSPVQLASSSSVTSVGESYKNAEEFWKAHPDYSKEIYISKLGEHAPACVKTYWNSKHRPLP